jgi:hypothetical protein
MPGRGFSRSMRHRHVRDLRAAVQPLAQGIDHAVQNG